MTVSIDIHPSRPGRELRITARALGTSGYPLLLQITDDQGNHLAEVTLYMANQSTTYVLAGAINALMRSLNAVEDVPDEVFERLKEKAIKDGQV